MKIDIVLVRPHNGQRGLAGLLSNCMPHGVAKLMLWNQEVPGVVRGETLPNVEEFEADIGGGWGVVNWWGSADRNEVAQEQYDARYSI